MTKGRGRGTALAIIIRLFGAKGYTTSARNVSVGWKLAIRGLTILLLQ